MPVLEKEQIERLEKAIEKTDNRSKDYHIMRIRKKINRYIEDLEDIAEARESLLDTTEATPLEEILKENGLSNKV